LTTSHLTTTPNSLPTRNVSAISLTLSGSESSFNQAAFIHAINSIINDSSITVVILSSQKRDFTVDFYLLGDDSSSTVTHNLYADLAANTSKVQQSGLQITGVSTFYEVVILPNLTTGFLPSATTGGAQQTKKSSGLTSGDKAAIGIVIPIGVILIVAIIIFIIIRRRGKGSDTEKQAVKMKKIPKKKPEKKDEKVSSSSSVSTSSETGSDSESMTSESSSKKSSSDDDSDSGSSSSSAESKSSGTSKSTESSKSSK